MSCLVLTGLGVLVVVILAVLKKLGILYQLFHKVGVICLFSKLHLCLNSDNYFEIEFLKH